MFRLSICHDDEEIREYRFYTIMYAVREFKNANELAKTLKSLGVIKTYHIGLIKEA